MEVIRGMSEKNFSDQNLKRSFAALKTLSVPRKEEKFFNSVRNNLLIQSDPSILWNLLVEEYGKRIKNGKIIVVKSATKSKIDLKIYQSGKIGWGLKRAMGNLFLTQFLLFPDFVTPSIFSKLMGACA